MNLIKSKLNFFAILLLLSNQSFGQVEDEKRPFISFEETKFDFGDIKEGTIVNHVFNFKNSGNEPLFIQNVLSTCGCTIPEWPKEPIGVGRKSFVKASFNSSGKVGIQNKVISVMSNASNSIAQVTITCNVLPKSLTPLPKK